MNVKSTEVRLRRQLEVRGLNLMKSHCRTPEAAEYGNYWITDLSTGGLVAGDQFGMSLEEVEEYVCEMNK